MSFLTQNDGGDFLPYINWGSQAVQWSKKEGEGMVTFQPTTAIFDIENIKVGWIKMEQGQAPIKILEHYKATPPAMPAEKTTNKQGREVNAYQKGFSVNVLLGKDFGEDRLFEFSTSQKGSLEAVAGLLEAYETGKDANQGKVPVVTFSGHTHKVMGKGSTNIPNLAITSWVDRPVEMDVMPDTITAQPAPQAVASGGSEF